MNNKTELKTRLSEFGELISSRSEKIQKIALVLASILLIAGLVYSLFSHPELFKQIRWKWLILLILVGVPLTLLLNVIELKLLSHLNQVNVPFRKCLEITIVGSAANMLPIPGSTLVRVAALKSAGSNLRMSTSSTILIGIIWLGVAFTYAGAWILDENTLRVGALFVVIGIAILLIALRWLLVLGGEWSVFLWFSGTKIAFVTADSLRLYFCFLALGEFASFAQVSGLAIAGVLGSAVSIVPAGLGIREGVSAVMSPIVGLTATMGFMAAFVNRLAGLIVFSPASIALALNRR